jgi:hypothetical protein
MLTRTRVQFQYSHKSCMSARSLSLHVNFAAVCRWTNMMWGGPADNPSYGKDPVQVCLGWSHWACCCC